MNVWELSAPVNCHLKSRELKLTLRERASNCTRHNRQAPIVLGLSGRMLLTCTTTVTDDMNATIIQMSVRAV